MKFLFKYYWIIKAWLLIYLSYFCIKYLGYYDLIPEQQIALTHVSYHGCPRFIYKIFGDCNYCLANIPCMTGDFRRIDKGLKM